MEVSWNLVGPMLGIPIITAVYFWVYIGVPLIMGIFLVYGVNFLGIPVPITLQSLKI